MEKIDSLPVECRKNHTKGNYVSPRSLTGSWMGDQWIPPPEWRLYSAWEMQDIFRNKTLLFLGDSTARRAAGTLYAMLNHTTSNIKRSRNGKEPGSQESNTTDPTTKATQEGADAISTFEIERLIDVNRKFLTEPCQRHNWTKDETLHYPALCRPLPDDDKHEMLHIDVSCFSQAEDFFWMKSRGAPRFL